MREEIERDLVQLNPFPFQRERSSVLLMRPVRTAWGSLSTARCMDERTPPRWAILNARTNFRYCRQGALNRLEVFQQKFPIIGFFDLRGELHGPFLVGPR